MIIIQTFKHSRILYFSIRYFVKKRFLNILAMHGGKLDHSTLFKRLVVTLKMCELIEDEEITGGKLGYIISVTD